MLSELKNYIGIENDDRDITLLLHLNASERYFRRICGDDYLSVVGMLMQMH